MYVGIFYEVMALKLRLQQSSPIAAESLSLLMLMPGLLFDILLLLVKGLELICC
jgi:hypothetical protein